MYTITTDASKNCLETLGKFEIIKKPKSCFEINNTFDVYNFCFNSTKVNRNKNEFYELFEFNMIKNIKSSIFTNFSTISNDLIENREDFEQMFSIFLDYISKDVNKTIFFQSKDSRVLDALIERGYKIQIRKIPNTHLNHKNFSFSGTKKFT